MRSSSVGEGTFHRATSESLQCLGKVERGKREEKTVKLVPRYTKRLIRSSKLSSLLQEKSTSNRRHNVFSAVNQVDIFDMASFATSLTQSSHAFLQPSLPLYTDTLAFLKHALDPLAAEVSTAQQERQKVERKKRKRGDAPANEDVLRLKQVHVHGLAVEQVWEQARRAIEAGRVEAERAVEEAESKSHEKAVNGVHVNGQGEPGSADKDEESLGEEGVDYEVEGVDADEDAEFDGHDDFYEMDEGLDGIEDDYDEEEIGRNGELDEAGRGNDKPQDEFVADKFGLNDGFFSIDNFNKQSEFLEQQDVRGDDDGAASDEEDVDWDADPLAGQTGVEDGADESEGDDEDGPTFGDPDAESEDEEAPLDEGEMDGLGAMSNTNDIMYADFFAPPAQKKKKNQKGPPNPHNFPDQSANSVANQGEQDEDVNRTIAAVHRDLFEDDSEAEEDDEADLPELDPSDPKSRRSAHERRKAALQEEIRKLEAANVAKRDWTLSGEARAADRPMNSLLEEDLEFERAGKPVPVVTAEVSESIEELIKRRILAHDFQDLIRRRPDDLNANPRRGKLDFELDDSKSKKGLAEEYEDQHLRATDPNYVDAKDEKIEKEEQEIAALWAKVSGELDSLSSWHFRPKRPAPSMEVRVDAPVVSMEDARPAAGAEAAGASQLAPQEVYKGGDASRGKDRGAADGGDGGRVEVVGKSGLPSGREEMGRDERKRRRRREKERIRKANANKASSSSAAAAGGGDAGAAVNSSAGRRARGGEKEKEMLSDLKRGGVKVIGKKGDVRDVEGNRMSASGEAGSGLNSGAGKYKL